MRAGSCRFVPGKERLKALLCLDQVTTGIDNVKDSIFRVFCRDGAFAISQRSTANGAGNSAEGEAGEKGKGLEGDRIQVLVKKQVVRHVLSVGRCVVIKNGSQIADIFKTLAQHCNGLVASSGAAFARPFVPNAQLQRRVDPGSDGFQLVTLGTAAKTAELRGERRGEGEVRICATQHRVQLVKQIGRLDRLSLARDNGLLERESQIKVFILTKRYLQ